MPLSSDRSRDRCGGAVSDTVERSVVWRAAAVGLLLAALWFFTPPAEPRIRLCGYYWLTGHPCPLCGLTRALFALGKGHWREALRFNALSPLGLVMLLSLFWRHTLQGRLWTAGIAAFAVYGVCRIVYPAA